MALKQTRDPSIIVTESVCDYYKTYVQWIYEIKERFRKTQIKAAIKVNSEQLLFNWQLGRDLTMRKVEEKWGNGIVEQLSLDLKKFPDVKGFSTTNLWYMKKWYTFYADDDVKKSNRLLENFLFLNFLHMFHGDIILTLLQNVIL